MRLFVLFAGLAALVSWAITTDATSRERAVLDGRVQVLSTGVEAALDGIIATERVVHALVLNSPSVVDRIAAAATATATATASALGAGGIAADRDAADDGNDPSGEGRRSARGGEPSPAPAGQGGASGGSGLLPTPVRAALAALLAERMAGVVVRPGPHGPDRVLTVYDLSGRILARLGSGHLPGDVQPGFRPGLARVLGTAQAVAGFESGSRMHGFRYMTPVSHDGVMVAVLESTVPYAVLAQALDSAMPEADFEVLLREPGLLNPVTEGQRALLRPSAMGGGHLRPPETVGVATAGGGGASGDLVEAALATLDREGLARYLDKGAAFAAFTRRVLAGSVSLLPVEDLGGGWSATVVAFWPGSEKAAIRTGLALTLAGALALLALLWLAMVSLRHSWHKEERENRQLATVTDTISAGLYVVDTTNTILMVNHSACAILGYDEAELVGRNAHDLFHVHSPDPQDPGPLKDCAIQKAIWTRTPMVGETVHFRKKSGAVIAVVVSCNPVDRSRPGVRTATRLREGQDEDGGASAETLSAPEALPPTGQCLRRDRDRGASSWHRVVLGVVLGQPRQGRWRDDTPEAVVTFEDISERQKKEAALLKLSMAVEQSSASVVITDNQGIIEYVNPAFSRVSGYGQAEAVGQRPSILKSGRVPDEYYKEMWETILAGEEWRGEFHNRRKDGSLYWERATISPIKDDMGRITHFVAVKDDVTERKEIEEELFHRANYDPLTGLPNRQLLIDRLTTALAVARRENRWVAVMFLDLDRFKQVNDTLGHNAGDVLLKQAASRLAAVLRPQDTLGRLGGDEFLVVAPGLNRETEASNIACRLLEVARQPFTVDGREIYVSASIGVSLGPVDGANPQVLMRNADAAMYLAKDAGRDGYHFFTPEVEAASRRRMMVENGLRTAVRDGSLHLVFQPIFSSRDKRIVKAEALIRWAHPQLGAVPPSEFIDVAEETGQILTLGTWVLEEACRALAKLEAPRDGSFRLAVNISSKQFGGNLHAQVQEAVSRYQIDPRMLEIEITERLLLHPSPDIRNQIEALRRLGVSIAIDDFGTGYSALSYLTVFRIDTLKIDRSFVAGLVSDPRAQALISAIIGMAHSLECRVVAEGVETEEQAGLLTTLGVDALQGYLLGRPDSLASLKTVLVRRDTAPPPAPPAPPAVVPPG